MASWKWFTVTSLNLTPSAVEPLNLLPCSLTSCSLIWGYQKQIGLMVNNHVYTLHIHTENVSSSSKF